MPFADGAKIQLINEREEKVENFFYYVDYEAYDSRTKFLMIWEDSMLPGTVKILVKR
jgi:hypothetical protein